VPGFCGGISAMDSPLGQSTFIMPAMPAKMTVQAALPVTLPEGAEPQSQISALATACLTATAAAVLTRGRGSRASQGGRFLATCAAARPRGRCTKTVVVMARPYDRGKDENWDEMRHPRRRYDRGKDENWDEMRHPRRPYDRGKNENWDEMRHPRAVKTEEKEQVKDEEEEPEFPVADGVSPGSVSQVWAPAAEVNDRRSQKKTAVASRWENPGLNVLERAQAAAEEGWQEARLHDMPDADMEDYMAVLPKNVRRRIKETEPPELIKQHVELHGLGRRRLRKLPKGIHRPVHFSGSDPMHNGKIDSRDNGDTSSMGRMAKAVHNGFMRLRATAYPAGLRGQPGVFPMAERPEVAFIGESNVGKSSLLNSLTRTMKLAPAADDPGVTRSINWYKCSRLPIDVIDLPGYGFAKGAQFGPLLADFICNRKALRTLYVLIDARTGLTPADWRFMSMLGTGGPEKVFILTKTDLVPVRIVAKIATMVLQDLRCIPRASQRLVMVSARMGNGMHDLRQHICERVVAWAKRMQQRSARLKVMQQAAKPGAGAVTDPARQRFSSQHEGREVDSASMADAMALLAAAA